VLSEDLGRRVVIVDTSNEIGGDGDVPHPAIGGARRMQVPDAARQHHVMIEAVENHMPQVGGIGALGWWRSQAFGGADAMACGGAWGSAAGVCFGSGASLTPPKVVIVDEIGTEAEALACRTIAER
jgi:stage III sporulation protein SpoIIIAA